MSWVSRARDQAERADHLPDRVRRGHVVRGVAENPRWGGGGHRWDTTLAYRHELWSYGLAWPTRTPPSAGWA